MHELADNDNKLVLKEYYVTQNFNIKELAKKRSERFKKDTSRKSHYNHTQYQVCVDKLTGRPHLLRAVALIKIAHLPRTAAACSPTAFLKLFLVANIRQY